MAFLLTALGVLLLLASLAGVAFGLFMALDPRTREPGLYFALWWTPAVATAGGILMGDPATFAIGTFCFLVAGIAFALERRASRQRQARKDRRARLMGTEKRTSFEEQESQTSGVAKVWSERAKRLFGEARLWLSEKTRTRK